ncbi:toll/interleukin-1 receptor domain-containing protein [Microbacterium sp. LWO12-1.2]|uniref:toll/interleukin-1 receptor domain-containing protein n=1 Tax=Microbacterium sp. LWO12-1.2 TaxID=3135261 RepID=UPI00342EEA3F
MSTPSDSDPRDFFISYTSADSEWAEWIAWQLELAGYTTVIQKWDFKVGSNFVIEMDKASKRAKRTLVVLSPAFLQSQYTTAEWAAAFAKDPEGQSLNVVPVLVEKTELDGLLSQIVHANLIGLSREDAAATLIAAVEPGRSKPTSEPPFPGARATADVTKVAPTPSPPALGWEPSSVTLGFVAREAALPRQWSNDTYAALEVTLVPADGQVLRLSQLEAMEEEFVTAGRASGLFAQASAVDNGSTSEVAYAKTGSDDAAGILVTRSGQRTAWITLPHDMLGSVLDPAQIRPRVARVLQLLMSVQLPVAGRYGFTARIEPSRLLMVGDASAVGHRNSASLGMGYDDKFPVPMLDTVLGDAISSNADELAGELIARIVAATRS